MFSGGQGWAAVLTWSYEIPISDHVFSHNYIADGNNLQAQKSHANDWVCMLYHGVVVRSHAIIVREHVTDGHFHAMV